MFRKNNNPYFQEIFQLWLLIPVFFGTSNVHLHTRPVNKLVMATAYSRTKPAVIHNSLNTSVVK